MFIWAYNENSESAKILAKELGVKLIRKTNSKFKGKDKLVINWGSSVTNEEIEKATVLNRPDCVAIAANKKLLFEKLKDKVSIPPFTTDRTEALSWVEDGKIVVVREKLTGSGGEGIVLLHNKGEWDNYDHTRAKLYVKYIPKINEYRIHVLGNEVMDKQRKAIAPGLSKQHVNFKIRNHGNGFIFARNDGHVYPQCVLDEAVKAVTECGLHFGAVDIIYNAYRKEAYVLEINTAPGITGETVETYKTAFERVKTARVEGNRWVINDDWAHFDRPIPQIDLDAMHQLVNEGRNRRGNPNPRVIEPMEVVHEDDLIIDLPEDNNF